MTVPTLARRGQGGDDPGGNGRGASEGVASGSMTTTTFGQRLRRWRDAQGMSQLELAVQADVSQRHISFLETGRSSPSREMVMHLGEVLEVPLRERNLLLAAAGLAPAYPETPLDQLDHISGILDTMLEAHEPNMALVVDRRWDLIRANGAALGFVGRLFPDPPAWAAPPFNLMRMSFHPEGMRRHMVGWEPAAEALLRRLERDAASHPSDSVLQDLVEEVRGYVDPATLRRAGVDARAEDLLVSTTYVVDGEEVSLFSTISIIGDAHDLTLAELRLETFWPADPASAERWRRLMR